jgi:hypothetical protein
LGPTGRSSTKRGEHTRFARPLGLWTASGKGGCPEAAGDRRERSGFTRQQEDGAAEALADGLSYEIATKGDIAELRLSLERKIAALDGKISSLDGKLSADIASVRSSTARWIITAVFINTAGLIGAVATVWQLAHK